MIFDDFITKNHDFWWSNHQKSWFLIIQSSKLMICDDKVIKNQDFWWLYHQKPWFLMIWSSKIMMFDDFIIKYHDLWWFYHQKSWFLKISSSKIMIFDDFIIENHDFWWFFMIFAKVPKIRGFQNPRFIWLWGMQMPWGTHTRVAECNSCAGFESKLSLWTWYVRIIRWCS